MKIDFKKFKRDTLAGVLLHLALAVLGFLVVALIFFYAYLPSTTNNGETITVPDIEGKSLSELETELEKRLLRFEVSDSSYSDNHPPLSVLKQYPHAGAKVKEGRKIYVTVNRTQPPTVPVPNLIDGSVVNAEAVLRSNQLKRGKIKLVSGPFNMVKDMLYKGSRIAPGTRIAKGSVIDLVVMDGGGGPQEMMNLKNTPFDEAKMIITGNFYVLGDLHLMGDTTDAVVIQQNPQPGDIIKVGDAVELWLGKPGTSPDEIEQEEGTNDGDGQ
jgi:eukaryotic-like serine/threonine-protein kinase